MKSSRRRSTLLLTLLLATTAAIGVYFATASRQEPETTAATAPPAPTTAPTVAVLVAKQDIAASTVLTEAMLEVRNVPVEARHARALTETDQAVGKITGVALAEGEQILDMRLAEAPQIPTDTFAGQVPVGMRAISVAYDEVIGAGALVQPGDHVDVIAYFEFEVADFSLRSASDDNSEESSDVKDGDNPETDNYDYKQYVTTYVVQNVLVLAVSQAVTPDQIGVEGQVGIAVPTPAPSATTTSTDGETDEPMARPAARSVTLAVTPEQAQRLLLAAQTVTEPFTREKGGYKGSLRLVLRAPGDTTVVDLGPAQLGAIPVGELLGDVDRPMTPSDLVIVEAEFTERIVPSGGILEFRATLKNVSDRTIKSGGEAPPEYVYTQGIAYDTLGFFPEENTYRIGLNVAGAYPTQFPYRWGLGRDLEPGETIEVVGSVRLTDATPNTRYWLGVIYEPGVVTQDGVGVADITVIATEAATVGATTALMRVEPKEASETLLELIEGDQLAVLDVRGVWFKVRFGSVEGWMRVEDLDVAPPGS